MIIGAPGTGGGLGTGVREPDDPALQSQSPVHEPGSRRPAPGSRIPSPMPEDPHTFHFVADKGDARRRLDHILVRRVTDISRFSRTTAQQWVDSGAVCVDGIVVTRPAARLREGAAV